MIIRALRVAECGRFDRPVAMEGLSGGLDLMVGPNEAGKSTLVKALRACLFQKHRSTHKDLTALRPYRGGAPLIEVELEIGAARWRVRKRFLADRMAEVASLDNDEIARGSDAEALLEQLVGRGDSAGRFGLVWLDQGGTLREPEPDAGGTTALRNLIEGEIAAVHGAGRIRGIRAGVSEMLAGLVTAQRGQRRGRFLAAQRAREASAVALEHALADFRAAEALIAQLVELDQTFAARNGPAARDARRERLTKAEAALAAAREITQQREIARTRAAEARSAANDASSKLKLLCDGLARQERLKPQDVEFLQDAEREGRRAHLEAAMEGARREASDARQSRAALEQKIKAVEALRRQRDISSRLVRTRQLECEIPALRRSIAAAPQDQGAIQAARRLSQRIAELSARLEAGAVKVVVVYEPGKAALIEHAGEKLADRRTLTASHRLVLVIPGLGQIEIEPGASVERVAIEAELRETRLALDRILSQARVQDLAEFETAYETAGRSREALSAISVEINVLAPSGREALERCLDEATHTLNSLGVALEAGHERPEMAALETELATAHAVDNRAHEALAVFERQLEGVLREIAVSAAARTERDRERKEIEASLPPPEQRASELGQLEARARQCESALDEALRTLSAWESRTTGLNMLEAAEGEVVAARTEIERAEVEVARSRAERAHVEGALEALRREDVTERLAIAEAEAARCAERLADIEEEVGALQMLDEELAAEEMRAGDLYSKPIADRLAPLLDMVFPGAALNIDRDYRITGFVREGRNEELLRLSDGTREQIAVLVRLAFARLLADRRQGVPLILDDALVFADDERIQRMHRVLELAASAHQVIVLSCREQAFTQLRGHRVTLEPWQLK